MEERNTTLCQCCNKLQLDVGANHAQLKISSNISSRTVPRKSDSDSWTTSSPGDLITTHKRIYTWDINHNNARAYRKSSAIATGLNYQDDSNCSVSDLHPEDSTVQFLINARTNARKFPFVVFTVYIHWPSWLRLTFRDTFCTFYSFCFKQLCLPLKSLEWVVKNFPKRFVMKTFFTILPESLFFSNLIYVYYHHRVRDRELRGSQYLINPRCC